MSPSSRARFAWCSLPLLAALLAPACAGPGRHAAVEPAADPESPIGYSDTPRLPDGWRVHDIDRPRPPVVAADASGRDLLAPPPPGAVVLFDGTGLDAWQKAWTEGEPAAWRLVDGRAGGAMEVDGSGTLATRAAFGDCELHLEWATPAVVEGTSQHRGNSGVFLMGRYEVQVLDSYRNVTYADGQAAALYGQVPPLRNVARGPGEWQSYDIRFRAPRFDGERCVAPARVSVRWNGVLVQDDVPFLGATAHREVARYAPHPEELPLMLQDHGNPVQYRNIWIRPLD